MITRIIFLPWNFYIILQCRTLTGSLLPSGPTQTLHILHLASPPQSCFSTISFSSMQEGYSSHLCMFAHLYSPNLDAYLIFTYHPLLASLIPSMSLTSSGKLSFKESHLSPGIFCYRPSLHLSSQIITYEWPYWCVNFGKRTTMAVSSRTAALQTPWGGDTAMPLTLGCKGLAHIRYAKIPLITLVGDIFEPISQSFLKWSNRRLCGYSSKLQKTGMVWQKEQN